MPMVGIDKAALEAAGVEMVLSALPGPHAKQLDPKVAELGRDREDSRFALVVDTRAGEYLPDLESALAELRETAIQGFVCIVVAAHEFAVAFRARRIGRDVVKFLIEDRGAARAR